MIDRLSTLNPWWLDAAAITRDPHLVRRARSGLRWAPRLVNEMDLSVPSLYTIRGPRQVGKSTALKLMIERSLRGAPQEEVLYYSFDLDRDPDAVREVVQTAKRFRPHATRWRIFLDEVTSVPGWINGVKWLWDNTDAHNDTFVVTGSSAVDIQAGAERAPGRRGRVERPDHILLPMSFADFAGVHGLTPPTSLPLTEFFSERDRILQASLRLADLQALLERYLRTGGFPLAVADETAAGTVGDETVRTIWQTIESEIGRQRREALRAYRILEHAVRALGQRTNWLRLGEEIGTHHQTAQEYAELMAKMFALVILYKYELNRGGPHLGAEKKLYLVDPLLAYIPHRVRQVGLTPDLSALVENAVITGLFRSEERPLAEEFALPQALFYWRSKSGAEVDAFAGEGAIPNRVPVEIKYQKAVTRRHLASMRASFRRGVLVTLDHLDLENPDFPQIPAAVFLWLLGGEHVYPQLVLGGS